MHVFKSQMLQVTENCGSFLSFGELQKLSQSQQYQRQIFGFNKRAKLCKKSHHSSLVYSQQHWQTYGKQFYQDAQKILASIFLLHIIFLVHFITFLCLITFYFQQLQICHSSQNLFHSVFCFVYLKYIYMQNLKLMQSAAEENIP